jgi:hypothetical protein
MSIDDLMIAIIIGGIGLTGAYLRAEFISWRRSNAAERRKKPGLRAERTVTRSRCSAITDFPGVLLSALVIVAILTGCHSRGSGGADLNGPFADELDGSLSGLVGTRLELQNGSMPLSGQFDGAVDNSSNVEFGIVDFNTRDPTGSFIFVANAGSSTVSALAIDAKSGALSPASGSPYLAGTLPSALAISD